MIEVFIFQSTASNKVTDNNSFLTLVMILESDHDHPMAFDTATPAIVAVSFADFARGAKFEVAVGTDIVVAIVTGQAVEAGC